MSDEPENAGELGSGSPPRNRNASFGYETGDGYRVEVEDFHPTGPTFLLIVDPKGTQVQVALSRPQARHLAHGLLWMSMESPVPVLWLMGYRSA